MSIFLIMSGSKSCRDNDRIYGYVSDINKAKDIVDKLNNSKEALEISHGDNYFFEEVDTYK